MAALVRGCKKQNLNARFIVPFEYPGMTSEKGTVQRGKNRWRGNVTVPFILSSTNLRLCANTWLTSRINGAKINVALETGK